MTINTIMILAFFVAFVFSFAFVPVARTVAEKIGAIDVPRDERRMHKHSLPRLGGFAIFLGFLISVLCFLELSRELISLLVGALIIVVLGIFDDSRGLPAKFKFCVQVIAALVVIYLGDIKIDFFTNPNVFSHRKFLELSDWIAVPCTVLWVVAITNAVNLIDGLDGLAAGVSAIASVSLVIIAQLVGQSDIALIAVAIAGACFGFLPFNFNPAKIIMGDTGSTFLGFVLAVLSIQGLFKSYAVISFAVPLLIFGLPIFDTSFAILRRLFNGKGIMTADRGHIHHRLVDMGFSQKQTVFILYSISGVLGITAVILAESGAMRALILLICVLIFVFTGSFLTRNGLRLTGGKDHTDNDDDIADAIQITFEDILDDSSGSNTDSR